MWCAFALKGVSLFPSLRLAPKLFAKTATANLTTLFFFDGAKERKKKNNERRKKDGVKIPRKKDKQKLSSSFFRRPSRFNTTINYIRKTVSTTGL